MFKGLRGLKHFIVGLLARPGVVSVTIYIHMLHSCMLTLRYVHIRILYLWFTLASSSWFIYTTASCLSLMHVGAAQARTRLQERQRVSPAAQVSDACHMMPAYTI